MKNKLFLRNEGGKRFAAIDIDAITYFSCTKDADFVRAEMWLPTGRLSVWLKDGAMVERLNKAVLSDKPAKYSRVDDPIEIVSSSSD